MIHARTNHIAAGILALALTIAVALSTTTVPASARTFNFNSAGSMVQQPLPPQFACAMQSSTQRAALCLPAILRPLSAAGSAQASLKPRCPSRPAIRHTINRVRRRK